MEWIAGDIGGTKSWLVWAGRDDGQRPHFERVYPSADFASAEALLRQFLADAAMPQLPDALILAVAGPSQAEHVKLTNLDWWIDAAELRAALGIPRIHLVNDFEAAAAGLATLTPDDYVAINPRPPDPAGIRAITGAGTGLGLAFLVRDDAGQDESYPTEGGHIDFAPADALQARLLARLREQYGHVSWERVVSGSAMAELYAFCCIEMGTTPCSASCDGACLVAAAAADDAAAEAALELFVDLYGAWIGNVALLYRPSGGLYIAGGVSAHLEARLQAPRFMAAALDKGRMRGVVESTPIFLITSPRLGVQGALAMRDAVSRAPRDRRAIQR
jgi:glucokinase